MIGTTSNLHDANSINYEKILGDLNTILGQGAWGNLTENRTLPNGVMITYHLSWATSMHFLSEKCNYRKKYNTSPTWLSFCDPSHRIELCEIALKTNNPLPESFDQLLPYIQRYFEEFSNEKLRSEENQCEESTKKDLLKVIETLLGVAGNYQECSAIPVDNNCMLGIPSQLVPSLYHSSFGETPNWLNLCHPYYHINLCILAIESNTKLPESANNLSLYIKEAQTIRKYEHSRNKFNCSGTVTLETALLVLVKSRKLRRILNKEFGSSKAKLMVSMMRRGVFSGEVGNDLHDFLRDNIKNESEYLWQGLIMGSEDEDDCNDYPIGINGYHGIYYVWALEYDDMGYFLDVEEAKKFMFSNWISPIKEI